jgi:capsular exopolysaccharide synthesis family protein
MSRIFNALRPFTGEDANNAGAALPERDTTTRDLQLGPKICPPGFEHLTSVRCHVHPQDRLVGCGENHDLAAEKFRFLRHRLNQLRQHRPLSRLLVTSSVPKEGKTLVSVNLAMSLARSVPRVALVDADMRQPGIHRVLGLDSLPGLAEFLEGTIELRAGIRHVDPFGFYYLPAGRASSNPFELLQGPRMRELVTLMAAAFDWIVFDSPPLIPFADAHCLATVSDSILLVVRQGLTPRDSLEQGLAALNGTHIAGVVFNASNDTRQDQYYYRYYPRSSVKKETSKAPSASPWSEKGVKP